MRYDEEYYGLLRESYELDLMSLWIESQCFIDSHSYLSNSKYFIESADEVEVSEYIAMFEAKEEGFFNKIFDHIMALFRKVIDFFRRLFGKKDTKREDVSKMVSEVEEELKNSNDDSNEDLDAESKISAEDADKAINRAFEEIANEVDSSLSDEFKRMFGSMKDNAKTFVTWIRELFRKEERGYDRHNDELGFFIEVERSDLIRGHTNWRTNVDIEKFMFSDDGVLAVMERYYEDKISTGEFFNIIKNKYDDAISAKKIKIYVEYSELKNDTKYTNALHKFTTAMRNANANDTGMQHAELVKLLQDIEQSVMNSIFCARIVSQNIDRIAKRTVGFFTKIREAGARGIRLLMSLIKKRPVDAVVGATSLAASAKILLQ